MGDRGRFFNVGDLGQAAGVDGVKMARILRGGNAEPDGLGVAAVVVGAKGGNGFEEHHVRLGSFQMHGLETESMYIGGTDVG